MHTEIEDTLRKLARPSDTPLCTGFYGNRYTTALDTSFGRIIRDVHISGSGLRLQFGIEHPSRKGEPTTFGMEAEVTVSEDLPYGSGRSHWSARAGQSAVGMLSPQDAALRAMLYALAAAEAASMQAVLDSEINSKQDGEE